MSDNTISNNENQFYLTCFKPLAVWMRVLGIELDPFDLPKRRIFCSRSFSFLMFSITLLTNLAFTTITFNQQILSILPSSNFKGSASDFWTLVIDFGSFAVLAIGAHATLLAIPQNSEWRSLWTNLQRLATENGQLFYSKSRKTVLTSLLFIIADGCINTIQGIFTALKFDDRPTLTKLADFFSFLTQTYGVSGLILFATIGWITSEGFVQLRYQVMALDPAIRPNPSATCSDLKKLRRDFLTLSEIVLHIGNCFGPLLFVWIVYIFISVIANSFYLVNSVRIHVEHLSEVPFWISLLIRNLIFLFVLASIPVTLQRESLNTWKSLRRISFDDPLLQCQLDTLTMEVLQSPTEMTAMDLFQVNLTLFPTLVGTTLTYLIILSQFQSK